MRSARTLVAALTMCTLSIVAGQVLPDSAGAVSVQLLPAPGQFFSVVPAKVLDTTDGTGGVPISTLGPNASLEIPVEGVGDLPSTGIGDVYALVEAISPTANGCLDEYSPTDGDPGVCNTSFQAGRNASVTDIVPPDDAGNVEVTNHSSGTVNVVVWILGYFSNGYITTTSTAGETFVALPEVTIADTRTGIDAPDAQLAAGASVTISIAGHAGVPAVGPGAALFIGAAKAAEAGTLSVGTTSSSVGPGLVSYQPGETTRDLYIGALSSNGQLVVKNNGPGPTDVIIDADGYLVSQTTSPAGGTLVGLDSYRILDTVKTAPLSANASLTFPVAGSGGIPASGVTAVAESVAAIGASANGFLSVYAAGTSDPDNPVVNFEANDAQDNDLDASLVSQVSPTGEETVTNHSAGTVNVVVSTRGYWSNPTVPDVPTAVDSTYASNDTTVTWQPPDADGGSPITGYLVKFGSGSSYTVSSGVFSLQEPSASTDTVSVAAINAVGDGTASPIMVVTGAPMDSTAGDPTAPTVGQGSSSSQTQLPVTLTGTVIGPNGSSVASTSVALSTEVDNTDDTAVTEVPIANVLTDSTGNWSYTLSSFASLPGLAQSAATTNNGFLNVVIDAYANATVGSVTYPEIAEATQPVYVGSGTTDSLPTIAPLTLQLVSGTQTNRTSNVTNTGMANSWAGQNDPTTTTNDGSSAPPTNQYGYQNSIGSPDSSYDPYIASDGTNLASVVPQPFDGVCQKVTIPDGSPWDKMTMVGSWNAYWNAVGGFQYSDGSDSTIGVAVSGDGQNWKAEGAVDVSRSGSQSFGFSGQGPYSAYRMDVSFAYQKYYHTYDGGGCGANSYSTQAVKMDAPPGTAWYQKGPSILSFDGKSSYDSSNQSYRAIVPDGGDENLAYGQSTTLGFAVSVMGIGLSASTSYSTSKTQEYTALDNNSRSHYIWGKLGRPGCDGCQVGELFSY
jgi:hypothetical protein